MLLDLGFKLVEVLKDDIVKRSGELVP